MRAVSRAVEMDTRARGSQSHTHVGREGGWQGGRVAGWQEGGSKDQAGFMCWQNVGGLFLCGGSQEIGFPVRQTKLGTEPRKRRATHAAQVIK